MTPGFDSGPRRFGKPYLLLCSYAVVIASGVLWYSQTAAFAWDEGFHLLCAQLIRAGKRPYIDFAFSQAPLNAYWNAFWMGLFGESWRTAHAIAALCTAGAVFLIADYIYGRMPAPKWRLAGALLAGSLVGFNVLVVEFGAIGQAYGLCLLLTVGAFRLAVRATDRRLPDLAFAAGLASGAAAFSSLLCAPVAPLVLIWMTACNRVGQRAAKLVAFVAGAGVSSLPLLALWIQAPRNVLFGAFQYNMLFRTVNWAGATRQNIEAYLSWLDCTDALLLIGLGAAGLYFVARQCDWDRQVRSEFYLCGWLAAALCTHVSFARPTFPRYYLLCVPFIAIPAVAGLYWIAGRLHNSERPWRPVLAVVLLAALALGKRLDENRDDFRWSTLDHVSAKVAEVVLPSASLLASEHVYFLSKHRPPSGMELEDSHKLDLPPALATQFHLVSKREIVRRAKTGDFDAIETCDEDYPIDWEDLERLYSHKAEIEDCAVFWGRAAPTGR